MEKQIKDSGSYQLGMTSGDLEATVMNASIMLEMIEEDIDYEMREK